MDNLKYEGQLDPRLDNFMDKISGKMTNKNIVYEQTNSGNKINEATIILEELDKISRMLHSIKKDIRSVVKEEIEVLMSEATLITEGAADELTIVLGTHKFKGKVKLVK